MNGSLPEDEAKQGKERKIPTQGEEGVKLWNTTTTRYGSKRVIAFLATGTTGLYYLIGRHPLISRNRHWPHIPELSGRGRHQFSAS